MSIRRGHSPAVERFTVVPNEWVRDSNLTLRARGLLVYLLSHREGWRLSERQLVEVMREGRDAIRGALRELEEAGYLRRDQRRGEAGRMDGIDYVTTDPSPSPGNPPTGEQHAEQAPSPGNPSPGEPSPGDPSTKKNSSQKTRTPEDQAAPASPPAERKRPAKATRLPEPFALTDELTEWARENAPMAGPRDHDAFCDHWRGVPGARGTKADWPATWRNWMRRASDDRVARARPRPGAETPTDRVQQIAAAGARVQARFDAQGGHL